jgi:hypothetical protein
VSTLIPGRPHCLGERAAVGERAGAAFSLFPEPNISGSFQYEVIPVKIDTYNQMD